ncbi:3-oxo-5-alpha-steroid 4-dehydrogenase, C-terminal [Parasponia andersonii]|uniref:3-oxo-5-alpha-steroid 4-dehydrogenase, C-terminal n=1 Tax=Parasponia andersonii TaxID=3476 RepID=A0A2P5C0Z9_PARAD|nr:3-oxo-5-alpha-steroid 4-dehydrogenase, C-terminal [Parasponia andersonii]
MPWVFGKLLFAAPPSLPILNDLSFFTIVGTAVLASLELYGRPLGYSKFWNSGSQNRKTTMNLSSRTGMILFYAPSFLASLASFLILPRHDLRFLLLNLALIFHFFKRIFEVLFIHKYSGGMAIDGTIFVSVSYSLSTAMMIYAQHLSQDLVEPSIDLRFFGVVLFVIGIVGNFYHHFLLSQLRDKGEKVYKIPKGGLFGLVICPHYLFEIIMFLGFSFISQTSFTFSCAMGSLLYLMGRSYATRKWYLSKFEDFPRDLKVVIPFVF